jgi:hypothetical protein
VAAYRKNRVLITLGCLLAAVLAVPFVWCLATEYQIRRENAKGLEIVRRAGGTIYAVSGGEICRLDAESGKWSSVDLPGEFYWHRHSQMTLRDGVLYAVDGANNIVKFSVNGKVLKKIEVRGRYSLDAMCLSSDGERLAFKAELDENYHDRRLCVCQVESGQITEVPDTDGLRPEGMCWDSSGQFLYVSTDGSIVRVNVATGELVKIATGEWPERLPDGRLALWRYDGQNPEYAYTCWALDPATGKEERLGRVRWIISGIAWDPQGRCAVAGAHGGTSVPTHLWRFDFLPPAVWDSKTGEMHRLPESGLVYADAIYWDRSYTEGK